MSGSQRIADIPIFGVRHLSPAAAYNLLTELDKNRPKCVLIEGPTDFNDLIKQLDHRNIVPPIALLAYTVELPMRTILYPLAEYSPEFQAIKWALANEAELAFMDLPAAVTIKTELLKENANQVTEKAEDADKEDDYYSDYYQAQSRFYESLTNIAGENDYESFWERQFEHCLNSEVFIDKVTDYSRLMREDLEDIQWESDKREAALNQIREASMKRNINKALDKYQPEEIMVVCGAYHVGGLKNPELSAMSDLEYEKLPKIAISTTLMPYSYYRLSSRSGYGAGNKAPAYFQLLWQCINEDNLNGLSALYLTKVGEYNREAGNYNSTASVIEAVRLAESLAYLHDGTVPTLSDLHDAAVCLLGEGEFSTIAQAIARVDIGTAIGELPEGLSQTPIQDDLNRQLRLLKLEKYKTLIAQNLDLDLRENRSVKDPFAAYLDLRRSVFFNRLRLLQVGFATFLGSGPSTWSENWVLRWQPENEIEIVEATLKGETVQLAAAYVLKEKFNEAESILEIAKLLKEAYVTELLSEVSGGLARLQTLCVDHESFAEAAYTALELADTLNYREIRNVDTTPLIPVLGQVFLRATLLVFNGAVCNDEATGDFLAAIEAMHRVSQSQYELINDELWLGELKKIATSDSRNAKISGAATALLMERGEISDEQLGESISQRLSYGVPADLAALWFEGLSSRNRYVLLSRISVWQQLDTYLSGLDDVEFKRAVVFLRRAFGAFESREKSAIIDILADLWQVETSSLGEFLLDELSPEQEEALAALQDFEF